MRKISIYNKTKDEKLFYYIKNNFQNLPSPILHKAFRNKDIKLNGKRTNDENYLVKNNDEIEIYIDDNVLFGLPKELNIHYEDENIIVIYKPQGILSNDEENSLKEPTFEDFVKSKKGENVKICHRLDRNTSGLIIFSKNDLAYSNLLEAFKEGYITKEYVAYVYGTDFDKSKYHYENYLLKDNKTGYSKIYNTNIVGSQKIITDIYLDSINKRNKYSILRVLIHTGKTHQIRSLLSSIGHPIIGDSKYGKNEINKKFGRYKQLLFAVKYSFNFPKSNYLEYLNKVTVNLDENLYKNQLKNE